MLIKTFFLFFFVFYSTYSFCQIQPDTAQSIKLSSQGIETNSFPKEAIASDRFGFISDLEFTLSIAVLVFGVLVFVFEVYLIKTNQISHENIAKLILVTLIVIGTLFLITAGYNNNQIAPATGLLGTIAGYLLGRTQTSESTNKSKGDGQ